MPRWSTARRREISIDCTFAGFSAFFAADESPFAAQQPAAVLVVVSAGALFWASAGITNAASATNTEVMVRMGRASLGRVNRFALSVFQNEVEADFDALIDLHRSEHQRRRLEPELGHAHLARARDQQ